MKKLLLLLILPIHLFAAAAWIPFAEDFFYDNNSIKVIGENIRVVMYVNTSSGSKKNFVEFDCKNERLRFLNAIYYAKVNLKGDILTSSYEASSWQYPNPDVTADEMLQGFCKRLKK